MLSCPAGPAQVCNYLLLGGDLPGAESVVRTTFAQTSLNMTLTGLSAKAPRQGATLHNGVTESQAQVGQSVEDGVFRQPEFRFTSGMNLRGECASARMERLPECACWIVIWIRAVSIGS